MAKYKIQNHIIPVLFTGSLHTIMVKYVMQHKEFFYDKYTPN